MKRPLQVYVESAELARIDAWSRRRGWTMSQTVRAALRALTHATETDPLLRLSGSIRGLPPDLSEQVDSYLKETFDADETSSTRSRTRRPRARVRG